MPSLQYSIRIPSAPQLLPRAACSKPLPQFQNQLIQMGQWWEESSFSVTLSMALDTDSILALPSEEGNSIPYRWRQMPKRGEEDSYRLMSRRRRHSKSMAGSRIFLWSTRQRSSNPVRYRGRQVPAYPSPAAPAAERGRRNMIMAKSSTGCDVLQCTESEETGRSGGDTHAQSRIVVRGRRHAFHVAWRCIFGT